MVFGEPPQPKIGEDLLARVTNELLLILETVKISRTSSYRLSSFFLPLSR